VKPSPPRILASGRGRAWLPTLARFAWAQTYPSRPVHWIVGFTPAGGNDIVARLMGQWLSVG
jgi:tripartite-type tricarboxylate transporter receptor subunit TctC